MDSAFSNPDREPSVLVTCSACGRLHAPESLLTPNPVCAGCQSGDPRVAFGDDPSE